MALAIAPVAPEGPGAAFTETASEAADDAHALLERVFERADKRPKVDGVAGRS